jgi:hypothetical protein
MQANSASALDIKKQNFNPVQVKNQIPFWLTKESSNFTRFLQLYYDWLANSFGYSGANVMDIAKLFDVDETPEFLLPNFVKNYAPDIQGIYNIDPENRPTPEQIRRTIKNIKTELYQRKSNEDAFRTLMSSLFGITADTIRISYPKRKLMRLNGGRLDWMINTDYYGVTGEYSQDRYTMVGSHLNQGVLPDSNMWQDFSYVLSSEIDDSNPYYEAVVKETLHPAGILGLYEKIERYSEGDYEPGPIENYEIPKVANYYPYNLQSTATLPRCTGCTGELSFNGWKYPTFEYPSWDLEISSKTPVDFGDITLNDFFTLSPVEGQVWPNDEIGTSCVISCGESGDIEFKYSINNDLTVSEQSEIDSNNVFFEKAQE